MQDISPANSDVDTSHVTRRLARFVATTGQNDLTPSALTWARHALLDWSGVTLAARDEPVVQLLIADLLDDGNQAVSTATLIGHNRRARLYDAVLINGTAGHALDYDDVVRTLGGHPSVPTLPVALALGETLGASGRDVLAAIVVGFEVECALGAMTGTSHYEAGFHNTATIGTFGAAATAAHLLRLDEDATARALGLAASMASGLKCNFGTMTKPFHAGQAAQAGLRATRLAARGFTANPEAIETAQGFATSQVPSFDPTAWASPVDQGGPFAIEATLFKYHAACYGTHGVLEAIGKLRAAHGVGLSDLGSLSLIVHERAAGNCDQRAPDSGLALKFSLRHLAVAALDGCDTGALETYSKETALDPRYVAARDAVDVTFAADRDRMTSEVVLTTRDGRVLRADADVGTPASDLDAQWDKLVQKFAALAAPVLGEPRAAHAIKTIGAFGAATETDDLLSALGASNA